MGIINDITFAINANRLTGVIKKAIQQPERNLITNFEEIADKYKNREAIIFEGKSWTYAMLDERANRYAHWVRSQNIGPKKTIALLMENRSDYIACWLGILKSGNVAALINNNLTGMPLAHSLNISNANHTIVGSECAEAYNNIADNLERPMEAWVQGSPIQGMRDLDESLQHMAKDRIELAGDEKIKHQDDALYIYTSGTTGNPKAARLSHRRIQGMMLMFAIATKTKPKDRNYITLPLYHSAGGVCAVGTSLLTGSAIILKRKFSVRDFWQDVHDHKVTQFQYIGEMCRYLVNAPTHPHERDHKMRLVVGNGLRPEVWSEFQPRFNIPKIIEFYGATEGNVSFVNFDGTIGAVGRIPGWARKKTNVEIVKFDVEKEEPVRGADGLCIKCGPDEVGEAIGEIFYDNPDMPSAHFEGYVGKKETDKKILRNVFATGDQWFRTGDLMKYDKKGYFYFIDRIGDTFRWKGENVATSEVAEVLSVFNGVEEANVFGVQIPQHDGRAGMASLCVKGKPDMTKLHQHLRKNLPSYAQPVFLRLQEDMEITGTFKHRKVELVKEGFNPEKINDRLYFNDQANNTFVPLDKALYKKITQGLVKL